MSDTWTSPRTFRCVRLPVDNVDTDQIIPARFLTTTARSGLGASLFADRRGSGSGSFDLEVPAGVDAALVVGANFGCGSSREHAVWALQQGGFQVVLGTSLADIFRRNALENGLLAIEISPGLQSEITRGAVDSVVVDLERRTVAAGGRSESFEIDPFARYCMLRRVDALAFLLDHEGDIAAYEQRRRSKGEGETWTH